jgi:hypothetical protein
MTTNVDILVFVARLGGRAARHAGGMGGLRDSLMCIKLKESPQVVLQCTMTLHSSSNHLVQARPGADKGRYWQVSFVKRALPTASQAFRIGSANYSAIHRRGTSHSSATPSPRNRNVEAVHEVTQDILTPSQ